MTAMSTRPAYDDSTTIDEMQTACREAGGHLARAARLAVRTAPSLHFDEQPAERAKPVIEVPEAAAALAAAIYGQPTVG